MAGRNEFIQTLLQNDDFVKGIQAKLGLEKSDTINQATGLLWYDLRPIVQLLYPFKELIPCIGRLPRVAADGGNAYHWKRITAVNVGNVSAGVSEGNRGARIAISVQDQQATYKTLGLESSVTFEARLGSKNLQPEALGNAVQSTLRSTMIQEEQILILGDASVPLGVTPTPSLSAAGTGSSLGNGTLYVICVALAGFGWLNYTPYNNVTQTGGVPGQVTKTNADGTTDTFGGGSAQPSAEASVATTAGQKVTATVAKVLGAVGYAWFVGTASGAEHLAAITQANELIITQNPANTNQPVTALKVGGSYVDNSTNSLIPDGILAQIFGSIFGSAPGTAMSTNPSLPSNVALSSGGSIVYQMPTANTGLTINGTNVEEFDAVLQAAYDLYKLGYARVLMSSTDLANFSGSFMDTSATSMFRILFEADSTNGRIIAGRRVTSYFNKFYGNTLDIEVHPYMPPGTVIFWSDSAPYELSGVPNILEAHVRQDYYQIQWPLTTRKYEYGVYVDEVFSCYFTPAFAAITNLNPPGGVPTY